MKVLIVGASGATGRLLVSELLSRGEKVVAIVRSPENLPESLRQHEHLSLVQASVLDLSDDRVWEKWKGQMPVIYNMAS